MVDIGGLKAAARIIKDYISMESAEDFMQTTDLSTRDFLPVPQGSFCGRTFAVDGSNAVILDWSVARANQIRAGYVAYEGRGWRETVTTFDGLFLADRRCYKDRFLPYLKSAFDVGDFHLEETELDRLSTYFRELQEYVALQKAVSNADPGDLVLYDGGFALWKERPLQPFRKVQERLFAAAETKEVDLLAVSKSSTFSWGKGISRPFVTHAGYLGSAVVPDSPWYVDLAEKRVHPDPSEGRWGGRIYVAKFHPLGRAFRVDAPSYVVDHVGTALAHAAEFSGSAESLGYPHALFRAHHEMKIDEREGELLRLRLRDEVGRAGLGDEVLRSSLEYHEILDMAALR